MRRRREHVVAVGGAVSLVGLEWKEGEEPVRCEEVVHNRVVWVWVQH